MSVSVSERAYKAIRPDPALHDAVALTPSLQSILESFQQQEHKDVQLLKEILQAKQAEDQRLAALSLTFVALLHPPLLQHPQAPSRAGSTSPGLSDGDSVTSSDEPISPQEAGSPFFSFSDAQACPFGNKADAPPPRALVMETLRSKLRAKAANPKTKRAILDPPATVSEPAPKRRRTSLATMPSQATLSSPSPSEAFRSTQTPRPTGLSLLLNAADISP